MNLKKLDKSIIDALGSRHNKNLLSKALAEELKKQCKTNRCRVYFEPHGKKHYSRVATITPPYNEPGEPRCALDYCKVRPQEGCGRWTKEKKYDNIDNLIKKLEKMGNLKKFEVISEN
tara:strand:- start:8498 stop:8851 length:354 start_codon:yes stop_codon:yes gene_type:complete